MATPVFTVAFVVIVEFSVLLTTFLALSAAPLERIRLGRIMGLVVLATVLLLATLFGLVPRFPLEGPAPLRLLFAGALILVAIAALELWALVVFVGDWRAAAGRTAAPASHIRMTPTSMAR
jgi:hypothetical protein